MYTVRNGGLLRGDRTVVLRVINKVEAFKHSRVVPRSGHYRLLKEMIPPGNQGKTFAWLEERLTDGNRPLTGRISLGRLPHITRFAKWVIDLGASAGKDEVAEYVELLLAWRWIRHEASATTIYRVYRDIWASLAANKVPTINARVRQICKEYEIATGFRDSSDVTEVVFALSCLLREYDIFKSHPTAKQHAAGSVRSSAGLDAVTLETFWDDYNVYQAFLEDYPHLASAWVHRGHLHSFAGNRSLATECFVKSVSINESLIEKCGSEIGAFTYGIPSEGGVENRVRDISFVSDTDGSDQVADQPGTTILYSANITFLRQYLPRILYYASALPNYRYHIHLVDEKIRCEEFIADSEELLRVILKMRQVPRNVIRIHWSHEPLPLDIGNPKTYYACARFLHADKILDRYGTPVWIQDADLFPTGPTDVFDTRLQEVDVMLNRVKMLHGLVPWKRFLAGSVYVADSAEGRSFLSESVRYIESFLGVKASWTLDQNALDWAMEESHPKVKMADGSAIGIPLTQTAMSRYLERPFMSNI